MLRPHRVTLGSALAIGWLAGVGALAAVHHATGAPDVDALSSSPAALVAGRVWTLVSSGFVIMGPPILELAGTAILVVVSLRTLGAAGFWVAALAGHIGATLLTYAGVGLLWIVARGHVEAVVDEPDYGISAVAAAAVGALLTVGVIRSRRLHHTMTAIALACVALFALLVPLNGHEADVEHFLALLLGAAVTAVRLRRPRVVRTSAR